MLPPVDTGAEATPAEDESGDGIEDDDPRLCPEDCHMTLPVDWVYRGVPPLPDPGPKDGREPPPPDPDPFQVPNYTPPRAHLVPAMVRNPEDGSLVVAEQRNGAASLHGIDRFGQLSWNVALPLPCDVCDLTHVAWHPSGHLLLSASGLLFDRGYGLLAARYDPVAHSVIWVTAQSLDVDFSVPVRSGEIAALSDTLVTQLYMTSRLDFSPLQVINLIAYGENGQILETTELSQDTILQIRHPLIGRATREGDLLVGIPVGSDQDMRGLMDRMAPPLWGVSNFMWLASPLDDLFLDDRGHALELGHLTDGDQTRLLLTDRAGFEPSPRWIATAAIDSTTDSRATLAVGPDGDPYAAVRTTQSFGEGAEPLVGMSLARWTDDGELRWQTTVLDRIDQSHDPLAIAIDSSDGIIVATVVDDQLRVERRVQRCECG